MQHFLLNFVLIYDNTLITTLKSIQNISPVEMKDCGDSFVFMGLSFFIIMRRKNLTQQEISEILEKYSTGDYSRKELGEEYNICTNSIGIVLIKNGYRNNPKITQEIKDAIFEKYETGNYNGADLAREYNLNKSSINELLRKNKYSSKSNSEVHRKYRVDETFFDEINTQEKAYFLGFLYADGNNYTPKSRVKISLQECDKEILIKLNNLIHYGRPLYFSKGQCGNCSNQFTLTINNKHISNRLVELGCMRAKSLILKFPTDLQVPKHLIHHFVRGYFDGDGCIHKHQVVITSTLDFCKSLSYLIKKELDINSYVGIKNVKINDIPSRMILSRRAARTFLKWMYKDSTIYLERKYKKYLGLMEYEEKLNIRRSKNLVIKK